MLGWSRFGIGVLGFVGFGCVIGVVSEARCGDIGEGGRGRHMACDIEGERVFGWFWGVGVRATRVGVLPLHAFLWLLTLPFRKG